MLQDDALLRELEDLLVRRARETAREVHALVARRLEQPARPSSLLAAGPPRTAGAADHGEDGQLRGIVGHAREIRRMVDAALAGAPPSQEKPIPRPSRSSEGRPRESGCDVLAILRGARRPSRAP
ncbi:unnamed protein product, partial [Prorocentrum cordatum]